MTEEKFTRYERARIMGARALQISMDAPLLKKFEQEELENANFDPLSIAEIELDSGVLPITVKRPLPQRGDEKEIEKIKIDEREVSDEKKIKEEKEVERDIAQDGEMKRLAASEDDLEEEGEVNTSSQEEI